MIFIYILGAIVVAFCFYAVRSVNKDLAKNGLTVNAPLTRISDGGDSDNYYLLTFEWEDAKGRGKEAKVRAYCDTGDLPRVGDRYELTYLPDNDDYAELSNKGFLRHDQAVQQ